MGHQANQLIHQSIWISFLVALLLVCTTSLSFAAGSPFGGSSEDEEFLTVDEAFQLTATSNSTNEIKLFWNIAEGYYLYRKRISVSSDDAKLAIGELDLPTGKNYHDEFFGDVAIYENSLDVAVPISASTNSVELIVGYQGCAHAGLCYPPVKKTVTVSLPGNSNGSNTSIAKPVSAVNSSINQNTAPANEEDSILADLKDANPLIAILLSLGFGILVAFTACMYPMIPILSSLIMGQGEKITTFRAFSLSLSYTQGIAITFGILGAIMALVGEALGIQGSLQTPWILIPSALLFIGLALSMFGFYEIQVPSALQSKLNEKSNQQKGGSLFGVGLMGVLSALIVGPCGGPVLLAVLAFAAQSQNPLAGFLYLWVFGTGMGLPLLIMGSGGGALLPKAGTWMDKVKATGGVIMIALAISFLERLSPTYISPSIIMLMWGALLIIVAVYLGALKSLSDDCNGWSKLWKGLGLILLIYGAMFLIGLAGGGKDTLKPLTGIISIGQQAANQQHIAHKRIKTIEDLNQELASAKAAGKPVMLDFYADWCAYCKVMEKRVFPDPAVVAALENVVFLQADITVQDEADKKLARYLDMSAPPVLYFWDAQGNDLRSSRLTGSVTAEQLAKHLNTIF
ncbi:MAG: protein-disulfide reductase DsbD [Gammaproteobacteria bacterium]|nr:protein-disulfide reductase DsbD [Gammaproteobacteria bacterium]